MDGPCKVWAEAETMILDWMHETDERHGMSGRRVNERGIDEIKATKAVNE